MVGGAEGAMGVRGTPGGIGARNDCSGVGKSSAECLDGGVVGEGKEGFGCRWRGEGNGGG
jgi:hypothetical protein